jgi:hypothetical protein
MCPICTKQHTPEKTITNKQWVCHTLALPFTLKNILRQKKKNYENSNISTCKNIIFKKLPLKETKILQAIITL